MTFAILNVTYDVSDRKVIHRNNAIKENYVLHFNHGV